MSSPEERERHRKRMKRKIKDKKNRVRSPIAKELIVSGKFGLRVIRDKRGKEHDLEKLDHAHLVKLLQELDE